MNEKASKKITKISKKHRQNLDVFNEPLSKDINKNINKNNYHNSTNIIRKILFIFILILIIINLTRKVNGSEFVSFSGFLNYISNAPDMRIDFNITKFSISDSWGLFDGFRQMLNVFSVALGFVVYLCSSLVNMLSYSLYFLSYLFV